MKKLSLFFAVSCFSLTAWAQPIVTYKYWVGFKDKAENPYSIERAKDFLSVTSLQRKQRLGVCLDETDLPVSPQYVEKLTAIEGVMLRYTSRWMNGAVIYLSDSNIIRSARELPFVKEVTLIGFDRLSAQMDVGFKVAEAMALIDENARKGKKESDTLTYVPYTKEFYGRAYQQIAMCNGDKLHQKGFTGSKVKIAVLDAGFNNYHILPAFKPVLRSEQFLGVYDFVQLNDTVFEDDDHGTNVLSCMAAYKPGKIVGTAPLASYLLLRCEDAPTEYLVEEYNWLAAAEYADSVGVDIITSSLGYTTFDDKRTSHTKNDLDGKTAVISIAAGMAASKGIMVVNSAGNEGDGLWKYIGVPADADNIFTIGAVDAKGEYAEFSSIGLAKDKHIKPTLATMGEMTMVMSPYGATYPSNGTSFSAPVFTGMLACLYQANPTKTPQQIMQALIMSGSQYAYPDVYRGYGIPDFNLANKILGGDAEHPMKADELLDISVPVNSSYLTLTFHSKSKQAIKVELTSAKGKKYNFEFDINANETQRFFIKKFKKMKKGKYTIIIRSANIDYTADVDKR